jgi:hypothetical protein
MSYWWEADPSERYWVEIRRNPGRIGTELWAPNRDVGGHRNGWWDLLRTVVAGETVYHYHTRERRFIGRSTAAADGIEDLSEGSYTVELRDFTPIEASVDLSDVRAHAREIYRLRDEIASRHDGPLYLPFQFVTDRSGLRFMSNYFAKMPERLAQLLFGPDGLASDRLPPPAAADPADEEVEPSGVVAGGFLEPFKAKADSDYASQVVGGRRKRTRKHETLVNDCAIWLEAHGLAPGRNAAVDLGTEKPKVIIEAKMIGSSWPAAIRQAVGQLYEYRFFKVADPKAGLIFLASEPVPSRWIHYLENDRGIAVIWRAGAGFELSPMAARKLRLRSARG